MNRVYLSLGTNLGDKEVNLHNAVAEIAKRIGRVVSLSAFHETAPWGFNSTNSFLNAAVAVDTELTPIDLLRTTKLIERLMGRVNKSEHGIYSDRLIDIDILLFNNWTVKTEELVIPHPLMHERDFVMIPLREILPDTKK